MQRDERYENVGLYDRAKVLDQDQVTIRILTILAEADKPLNKYEIGAKIKNISKPRLYKNMKALELWRLVEVADIVKARMPGSLSKYYRITNSGLRRLVYLTPNREIYVGALASKIAPKDFEEVREKLRQVRADYFKSEFFLSPLRKIMIDNKGPPNIKWTWTLTTDSHGQPTLNTVMRRPRIKVISIETTPEEKKQRLIRADGESRRKLAKATKTRPEDWKQTDYATT